MCGFYCIAFIEYMLAGKGFLDYTNLFTLNDYKKNEKIIYAILMTNMSYLEFRISKIDEARNYLLEETKHNNIMSEKYKMTCNYLNYIDHLLILVSTSTGCVSISAFSLLVCVLIGITNSAAVLKT